MAPNPLSEAGTPRLQAVHVVATDIDGTLTSGGKLAGATVVALEQLARAGLRVILVTGRSAGWGNALASYLPGIAGVVAENGAVLCLPGPDVRPLLFEGPPTAGALRAVEDTLAEVLAAHPAASPGADNYCRLTDRTVAAVPGSSPSDVAAIASRHGVRHTYSTVHHHLSASKMDKRSGTLAAIRYLGLGADPGRHVLTVGDSANDAPLWDRDTFALTVGVAGALAQDLPCPPELVTASDGGAGFRELASALLAAVRRT